MSLFNFGLHQGNQAIAETFYELEPEPLTPEEEEVIFEDQQESQQATTNQAFNSTKKYTHFAEAFKPIAPPEDYVPQESEISSEDGISEKPAKDPYKAKKLDQEALDKFKDINKVLDKKKSIEDGANTNSTVSYSLIDRMHRYLPTPIYLCEKGGKVVVNITVNGKGEVINAYINSNSKSQNECLKDHALEYALEAIFDNKASKPSQLGSITFYFQGKH